MRAYVWPAAGSSPGPCEKCGHAVGRQGSTLEKGCIRKPWIRVLGGWQPLLTLALVCPSLSVCPVPLSLGLWEARPWLITAPCVSREENQQNFAVARTYTCESPDRRVQGWARDWECPHQSPFRPHCSEAVARPDLVG